MMFQIHTQSRVSVFEQLRLQIMAYIGAGVLQKDDPLPNAGSLAAALGINPHIVDRAYRQLEKRQIICRDQNACYICGDPLLQRIKEEKLRCFDVCVQELRQYPIKADELKQRIDRVWKEGDGHA